MCLGNWFNLILAKTRVATVGSIYLFVQSDPNVEKKTKPPGRVK